MFPDDILFLAGKWQGKGIAEYPGINNTVYSEDTVFEYTSGNDYMCYRQDTKYADTENKGASLHIESGFIKHKGDGRIELLNSQNNGRVEVMTLIKTFWDNNSITAVFESMLFGNDPRMIKSYREYRRTGNTLLYNMKMAAANNKELRTHLTGELSLVK